MWTPVQLHARQRSLGVDSNLGKGIDGNNKVVEGVNTCKAYGSNPESFDVECTMYSRDVDIEDAWCSMEAPKYWELDSSEAHQIIDVQGKAFLLEGHLTCSSSYIGLG